MEDTSQSDELMNISANLTLSDDKPVDVTGPSHQLDELKFWINTVLTNLTVILGLIGNVLTITILSKRVMRSSTNIYLCILAIWDCVVLCSTLLLIGLPAISQLTWYLRYVYPYVVSYLYPIALIGE